MSAAIRMIEPLAHPPDCTVRVPGSKSMTNRAVLIAALAQGESVLDGALASADTRYMTEAWQQLGVDVRTEGDERVVIGGRGGVVPAAAADLFVGNAGTAMRFLVAALCLGHGRYRIDGTARMRQRPIQDEIDALTQLGARCRATNGCPPVSVEAEGLPGGRAVVAADKSSQFLSAILQAAPYAARAVEIEVPGTPIAQPYIDMTIAVMRDFGVHVERDGYRRFIVSPQAYCGRRFAIEPDASGAHYFWAAAALCGGHVRVDGLGSQSVQGDVHFADVLEQMGAKVTRTTTSIEVSGTGDLDGVDVDMNAISDTAPTLAALAPFARRPVRIRNIAHVRLQESDRLRALATELQRLGVKVRELDDGLAIEPSHVHAAVVDTYDDHRLAMAFALIGLRVPGIGIRDPECVGKTFPGYFQRLEELRG